MYYPLQIPYLLNKKFKEKIEYKEYKYEELEKAIMCIWSMKSIQKLEESMDNIILPDGCIDLIVNLTEKQIFFSAFSKATEYFKLTGEVNYIGVRFRPGTFYNLYKIESSSIMDTSISYTKIEQNNELEKIYEYVNIEQQLSVLVQYLRKKMINYQQSEFEILLEKINENLTQKNIEILTKDLSYSQRQVNRLFYKQYGVSPKTLLNILRLHKCLELLLKNNHTDLTKLALSCGFYDQSHFIKEIRKYCNISPIELIKQYKNV